MDYLLSPAIFQPICDFALTAILFDTPAPDIAGHRSDNDTPSNAFDTISILIDRIEKSFDTSRFLVAATQSAFDAPAPENVALESDNDAHESAFARTRGAFARPQILIDTNANRFDKMRDRFARRTLGSGSRVAWILLV
ncbi:MAG TPA: hypothetical protein DCP63_05525 [Bacteroidetes bacterium]|nr:hypothetical protein [Bacteroidota bacterium]